MNSLKADKIINAKNRRQNASILHSRHSIIALLALFCLYLLTGEAAASYTNAMYEVVSIEPNDSGFEGANVDWWTTKYCGRYYWYKNHYEYGKPVYTNADTASNTPRLMWREPLGEPPSGDEDKTWGLFSATDPVGEKYKAWFYNPNCEPDPLGGDWKYIETSPSRDDVLVAIRTHWINKEAPPPDSKNPHSYGFWAWSDNKEEWIWVDFSFLLPACQRGAPLGDVGDPVNSVSGFTMSDATDIYIPCPGLDLVLARSYNSGFDYTNGVLGARWIHTYEWNLVETNFVYDDVDLCITNGCLEIDTPSGATYTLVEIETNYWQSFRETCWSAYGQTNGDYEIHTPGKVVYTIDTNGFLKEISDSWQNTISLTYTNNYPGNQLVKAGHSNGQYLEFSYDTNGLLTRVDTPDTNFYMTYTYNSLGELTNATRHTASDSYITTYLYDSSTNHCVTQRVNSAGHAFKYTYKTNAQGATTLKCDYSVVESNYYETSLAYYTNSAYSTVTQTRGNTNLTFDYHYHSNKLVITKIYGPNSTNIVSTYDYDKSICNVTNKTIEDKTLNHYFKIRREFDFLGNVTNESRGYCVDPANVWHYTWYTNDSANLISSITDPLGHKTEYTYTNASVARTKLYYNSTQSYDTVFSYTTNGLLAGVTNSNSHWIKYYYDQYGFPTSTVPQVGPPIEYRYSRLGHMTNVIMSGASGERKTIFDVDELGRVNSITYPDNTSENFYHDSLGNVTSHIDTAGRTTTYEYLPTRKLEKVIRHLSDGSEVTNRFNYDNQFNTLDIFDEKGRSVETYLLDLQDRPTSVTNVEGQTMTINYGISDYVLYVNRFDGTLVTNSYNSQGLISQIKYPDATNTFTYLANGLQRTVINSAGTVSNTYNFANRLISQSGVVTSGKVDYAYLPAGNVSNVSSVAGTTAYSYDNAERISSIESPEASFEYSYNSHNGLVSRMASTNCGIFVDYVYNSMDRITSITWNDSATNALRSFTYLYDNAGMITNMVLEDGLSCAYEYDDLNRLTRERRLDSSNNEQYNYSYDYDPVGNRTGKASMDTTISYTLPYGDSGNLMSGWTATSTNWIFAIDVYGYSSEVIGLNPGLGQLYLSNMLTSAVESPEVDGTNFWSDNMVVSAGNQDIVATIGDQAGNLGYATNSITVSVITNADYTYNIAGCLTNIRYNGAGITQTTDIAWNGQYQVTSISTNGTVAESYQYDPMGRRTRTISSNTTNFFAYNGNQVVAEVNASGQLQKSYTWGQGIDNLLSFTDYAGGSTNTYYCLTDHLGSVHAVVDSSGSIVESYRYDAFGRVLGVYDSNGTPLSESAIGNHYLWQGRWYSWATGLYDFRARAYDPVTGRWLSKDPIGISGGLNQYVFCNNNPVNFTDPLGLWAWDGDWIQYGILAPLGLAGTSAERSASRTGYRDDFLSGDMGRRGIASAKAMGQTIGGVGQLLLAPETGAAAPLVGMYGAGNVSGGAGAYLNVFDQGNREWNFVKNSMGNWGEVFGNRQAGEAVYHISDAAIGLYGIMRPVPQHSTSLQYGVERFWAQPAFTTGRGLMHGAGVLNDIYGVSSNIRDAYDSGPCD